jgi:hypothetical protein
MAFVIHGIKYWMTEIFHMQDIVSFYRVLIIMPDIRLNFIIVGIFMILRKELHATFMTVVIIVINPILAVNLPCPFGDSYCSCMLILFESNLRGIHDNNPHQYLSSGCQVNFSE